MYTVEGEIPRDIQEIAHWVATDKSDYARHIREMFRPIVDQFSTFVIDFGYGDHRHIMRRKIRKCYR